MQKFNVIVSKEYELEVEIDDEALDSDSEGGNFIADFKKHFYKYNGWKQHAEHIGRAFADGQTFIEGYGIPYENGKPQVFHEDDSEPAINVRLIRSEVYSDSAESSL